MDPEPPSAIVRRLKSMDARDRWWRGARRITIRASMLVLLVGAARRFFDIGSPEEVPLQTVATYLELAVVFALGLLDKAREGYELPKLWLDHNEFLVDEHHRLDRNIRLDEWTCALVYLAILGAALYVSPYLSAALQKACLSVTGAAVLVLWLHDHRRLISLKRSRAALAAQLGDPPRE